LRKVTSKANSSARKSRPLKKLRPHASIPGRSTLRKGTPAVNAAPAARFTRLESDHKLLATRRIRLRGVAFLFLIRSNRFRGFRQRRSICSYNWVSPATLRPVFGSICGPQKLSMRLKMGCTVSTLKGGERKPRTSIHDRILFAVGKCLSRFTPPCSSRSSIRKLARGRESVPAQTARILPGTENQTPANLPVRTGDPQIA